MRKLIGRELIESGLWVTNWGTLVAPIVAEHALLLTLSALRNQAAWPRSLTHNREEPKSSLQTRTLHGKRIALHGFGAIAQALIALLRPFNPHLTAFSTGMPRELIRQSGVETAPDLATLCRDADVLISCEALTPLTARELSYEILSELPAGSVFINVGRGGVVDEAALFRVVRERSLRVGIDVFGEEPLAADSPYVSLPDAILSPHIGGPTHDYYGPCGAHALANLAAFRRGETPQGLITPAIYDRST